MAVRAAPVEEALLNSDFWEGKRVFLTGHTGFKGAWLSLWLQQAGAEVSGYSLDPPSSPSLYEQAAIEQGMDTTPGDVRDPVALSHAISRAQPEIVIHMAAQSLLRRSFRDPLQTYETNVMGTANLLQSAARLESVRVVVAVTSDKCYRNDDSSTPFRETDPLGGSDPYSSSKACAEIVTDAYRSSFYASAGRLVCTVRAGNVIGAGDWAEDRLIPDLVRAAIAGKAPLIRNPSSVRPWQHVLDCLNGYMVLVEKVWGGDVSPGAWNFGPLSNEDIRPVSWVADKFLALWPQALRWEAASTRDDREARTLRLDSTKAHDQLGWSPVLSLATALEWVVEWHLAVEAGKDARHASLHHLERYEKLALLGE